MVTISLNLSGSTNYKFTDPVRKYKANDPYYYEVDNIPINQLEENILWIKDAVENISIELPESGATTGGASRETFTELQPFVSGTNSNTVSVRPGRFMARINDAYGLSPLQIVERTGGLSIGKYKEWQTAAINNNFLAPTLFRFQQYTANAALGMNGLAEKSFGSFAFKNLSISGAASTQSDGINPLKSNFGLDSEDEFTFPKFLWGGNPVGTYTFNGQVSAGPSLSVSQYKSGSGDESGFFDLFKADTQLIKKWRGIARTAVVDVPEVISIDIQNFEPDDYSYVNDLGSVVDSSNGASPAAQATQRIDLLFIYSKPIDLSAVSLAQGWSSEIPRKIYKAELGIVKGAGLTLDYSEGINPTSKFFVPDYENQILANSSDELNQNLGFKTLGVRGSFPAPDDLMNMAPALADWLPNNHYALVGQSILPIAYIVVKKNNLNEEGNQIIDSGDIIDIRPFFRTTELTYGERAGIAAAVPSLSLANPVATESLVYERTGEAYTSSKNYTDSEIAKIKGTFQKTRHGAGKVISRGLVRGGNWYGPEGALCRRIKTAYGLNKIDTINIFKQQYNLGSDYILHNLPDWDLANWCVSNRSRGALQINEPKYPAAGWGITDRIYQWSTARIDRNRYYNGSDTRLSDIDFGPYAANPTYYFPSILAGRRNSPYATWNMEAWNQARHFAGWIQKRIKLDITDTPWVKDITIAANFWNCMPVQNISYHHTRADYAPGCDIFVSKGDRYSVISQNGNRNFIEFSIFVSLSFVQSNAEVLHPWRDLTRRDLDSKTSSGYNLFAVLSHQLLFHPQAPESALAGASNSVVRSFGESINDKSVFDTTEFTSQSLTTNSQSGDGDLRPHTALPICIYPTVEFTVFGHPSVVTYEKDANGGKTFRNFANSVHQVPGMKLNEGVDVEETGSLPTMKLHAIFTAFDDNTDDIPNEDTRIE